MTVALRSSGAIAAGSTSAAANFNSSAQATDAVFLASTWKPDTATAPTITGWSKVVDQVLGSGTPGPGTGPQRLVVWRQDSPVAGQTGSVTVTPVGGSNIVLAGMIGFSKTAAAWDITYDYANDTSAGANLSAPSQAQIAQAAGDLLAYAACHCANTNMGSTTVTTPGVTYGSAVEHADAGSTTGDDARFSWGSRPVTAGPQTGLTTFSSTITGTITGGAALIRLREGAGGPTTHDFAATIDAVSASEAELTAGLDLAATVPATTSSSQTLRLLAALQAAPADGVTAQSFDLTSPSGDPVTHDLAATIPATTATTATLTLGAALSATSPGTTGVTANLRALLGMAATTPATSSATVQLTLRAALSATVAAISESSAALALRAALAPAPAAATSGTTGALSLRAAVAAVWGAVSGLIADLTEAPSEPAVPSPERTVAVKRGPRTVVVRREAVTVVRRDSRTVVVRRPSRTVTVDRDDHTA